jgi:diguanylate cyclase (GGDEF)-like protein
MFSLSTEKSVNLFIAILTPFAIAAVVWAIFGLTADKINTGLITLAVLTAFCSYYLRIELPRVNIHLTISDGLVILSMLLYGGEVALLLAVTETAVGSLNMFRKGFAVKSKTILVNMYFAAIAVFIAGKTVTYVFGSTDLVLKRGDLTSIAWMVGLMALSMFVVNSAFVAFYSSLKKRQSFWSVWTDNCFNAVVMYLTGAVVAGITYIAQAKTDILLFAAVIGFFGVIYLTFKRFVDDVKRTVGKAKQAELERAEQAEQHVNQLQHYVAELERSGKALQESHENFRHAAFHDALTGLPNRNYFIETLKELLLQCKGNSERSFAVLFLDLKSFKTINDSLGHSVGDRLIKNVGKRLSGMVREDDMVGRFGGDKFGVILKGLLTENEATSLAERMATGLAEPYTLDGRQVFTSARIGIAYGNSRYSEAEDILRDADIAMYYSKENGENYVVFDQRMHTRAVTRLQLETDLRYAIEREEFELYYQPIIGLNTAALVGFEALVRWNHPQRGLVPPNEFIQIAENTGLIIPMTVKILQSACSQVVKWQKVSQRETPLSIAVNLSGKHFGDPGLVEQIKTIISATKIDPADLKLEITESAVMENAETAISMLKQIKQTGVQISIDDFGTGYSSLSYLHRFPIDLLKVDRSFVSAMEENTENGEIVRTVIALAKALKLSVVAEGIESIHQFHQLRVLGCQFGQGYLFSKPLPVPEIEQLIKDDNRWQHILPPSGMPVVPQDLDILEIGLTQ